MANLSDAASHAVSVDAASGPRYLDFNGALQKLQALGFQLSKSQLRERVRHNVLPFFKEAGKLYISEQALEMHYLRRQTEAERGLQLDRQEGRMGKGR